MIRYFKKFVPNKKEVVFLVFGLLLFVHAMILFSSVSPIYSRYIPKLSVFFVMDVLVFYLIRKIFYLRKLKRNIYFSPIFYFLPELILLLLLYFVSFFVPLHEWPTLFRSVFTGYCFAFFYSKVLFCFFSLFWILYCLRNYYFKDRDLFIGRLKRGERIIFILCTSLFLLYSLSVYLGKKIWSFNQVELSIPDLPSEFDGFKIVHLSDLHAGSIYNKKVFHEIVEKINHLKPDLICVTGDLVSHSSAELIPILPDLKRLSAEEGIFVVLGNHDYNAYSRYRGKTKGDQTELINFVKDSLSWTYLNNEIRVMKREKDSICLAGVEYIGKNKYYINRGEIENTLKQLPCQTSCIFLLHDPYWWKDSVAYRYPQVVLTLSGHTHAKQYRVPSETVRQFLYWLNSREMIGLYEKNDQYIYVNAGIGTSQIHGRMGAWMEVTEFILRKGLELK